MMTTTTVEGDDELDFLSLTEHHREFMALQSDADYAFSLQLQEAINASLFLNPASTSSSSPPSPSRSNLPPPPPSIPQTLRHYHRDFQRLLSDQVRVPKTLELPEEERAFSGHHFSKPYHFAGESSGSSSGCINSSKGPRDSLGVFKVYCKGVLSEDEGFPFGGIGIVIFNSKDSVIFENSKNVVAGEEGLNWKVLGMKGLIEGLNAALDLDLKRVNLFVDSRPLHRYVTGRWVPKPRKIVTLCNQISVLISKFENFEASLVHRHVFRRAYKLARHAIESQVSKATESSVGKVELIGGKILTETCVICLEETDVRTIFSVDVCKHRYCFSCMKKHVEAKLLDGLLPKCPHGSCKNELHIDSCGIFLTPKLIGIMRQRLKEASIPVVDKLYCPYPRCSALMSKRVILEGSKKVSGKKHCIKCGRFFCIFCKVPWHKSLTCAQYKKSNHGHHEEDVKLKSLANTNRWRQCQKCNHMIELNQGCYHMTCRCGHEFCYTCGAEWEKKNATCTCPLWDEEHIMDNEDDDFDDDDDEDEDEYDESEYEDVESDYTDSDEYLLF